MKHPLVVGFIVMAVLGSIYGIAATDIAIQDGVSNLVMVSLGGMIALSLVARRTSS